jgi:hypothetical protein
MKSFILLWVLALTSCTFGPEQLDKTIQETQTQLNGLAGQCDQLKEIK